MNLTDEQTHKLSLIITVLKNGLDEHISLIGSLNDRMRNNDDIMDYQTCGEVNEALVELERILIPKI